MVVGYCPRCGKVQFSRYGEAERVVRALARRHHERSKGSVYRCHYCHYFHVTSKSHRWGKNYRQRALRRRRKR